MRETEAQRDKIPPQSIEAEQSVLGAILLDNDALHEAIELLTPDDLYRDAHRRVFQAMCELYNKSEPVDLITLSEFMKSRGELEAVGGVNYLSSLASFVPTSANIKYHSKIVREKALIRSLLYSVTDIAKNVYDNDLDTDELIDYAEKKIFDLSDKKIKTSFYSMKELISDTFVTIERLYDKKEAITGSLRGLKTWMNLPPDFRKATLSLSGKAGHGKDRL